MNTSRRNLLVALSGSAAAGGALFGAGAFSTVEAERTAQVEVVGDEAAALALEPIPGEERDGEDSGSEDNPYAKTNGDGELVVAVDGFGERNSSGVNPNAVTRIPRVFRITNNFEQSVQVSVTPLNTENGETEINDVVFYDESDSSDPGEASNVDTEVGAGETIEVSIDIDTTTSESDVTDLDTIRVRADDTDGGSQ